MVKPSPFSLQVLFFSIRIVIHKVSNFTWSELKQKPNRIKAFKIDTFLGVMVLNKLHYVTDNDIWVIYACDGT